MAKIKVESLTMVGRPFAPAMMDDNKSFGKVNAQMENKAVFQQFVEKQHLGKQRAILIEFAPDTFMYWYGVIVPSLRQTPRGLMKYVLPAAAVLQETATGMANSFDLPLNFLVQNFFKKAVKTGLKVYQNPGYSKNPYLLQELDLTTKKLTQTWYGQVSE